MSDKNSGRAERGGRDSLQKGGYTPSDRRGYVPTGSGQGLPKAPPGGTGQSNVSTNKNPPQSDK